MDFGELRKRAKDGQAFDPPTVLALLDEIERLMERQRKVRHALRAAVNHIGEPQHPYERAGISHLQLALQVLDGRYDREGHGGSIWQRTVTGMGDRCPRCGVVTSHGTVIESHDCLRNQLSQAKERIEELARERDELQAKLDDLLSKQTGTTPDSERGKGKCLTNEQEQMVADIERAERRRLK